MASVFISGEENRFESEKVEMLKDLEKCVLGLEWSLQ